MNHFQSFFSIKIGGVKMKVDFLANNFLIIATHFGDVSFEWHQNVTNFDPHDDCIAQDSNYKKTFNCKIGYKFLLLAIIFFNFVTIHCYEH